MRLARVQGLLGGRAGLVVGVIKADCQQVVAALGGQLVGATQPLGLVQVLAARRLPRLKSIAVEPEHAGRPRRRKQSQKRLGGPLGQAQHPLGGRVKALPGKVRQPLAPGRENGPQQHSARQRHVQQHFGQPARIGLGSRRGRGSGGKHG